MIIHFMTIHAHDATHLAHKYEVHQSAYCFTFHVYLSYS